MVVLFRPASCFVAFTLASAFAAHATGIRIAGNPPSQSFGTMQAAVDAAVEGDVLLVQPGDYGAAVIENKSLSIVAMNGTPQMGDLTVVNLSRPQSVFVSGITIQGASGAGVTLIDDAGDVRFQDCVIQGGRYDVTGSQGRDHRGASGIDAQSCEKIVVAGCQVTGGDADAVEGDAGLPGGAGLDASDCNVVLYDGTFRGGAGSEVTNPGGAGGDGCRVQGMGLFASGTTFVGGHPGRSDYLGCNFGGEGGDAIDATNEHMQVLDLTLQPASGGFSTCGTGWFGADGVAIRNSGSSVHAITGTHRTLQASALASDAAQVTITVTGRPGDRFYLARSFDMGFASANVFHGVWMLYPQAQAFARSVVPASGVLTMQVQNLDVTGALHGLEVLQGWCVDATGQIVLTGAAHVELFDAGSGPDCDGNGVDDYVDLITGTSADANQNGIPDGCPGG